ncbi:MAG: hypothetical protein AAF585_29845, partial [Verrucomicrobiota bacterium]
MHHPLPTNALDDEANEALMKRYIHFQDESQAAFKQHRKELVKRVVNWRWATDQMASPEPYYKKLFRGGRWRKDGKQTDNDEGHGFDDQGRIVVIDAYHSLLFDYGDDFIEEGRFDHRKCAIYIRRYFYNGDGQLDRALTLRYNGGIETFYVWDGDRILRTSSRCWSAQDLLFKDETWSGKIRDQFIAENIYNYDEHGELDEILRVDPDNGGTIEVKYRRKKRGD